MGRFPFTWHECYSYLVACTLARFDKRGLTGRKMAEWVFDRRGRATLIVDDDCVRSRRGRVIGWISGSSVYSLRGTHGGWHEDGVFYDSANRAIGFVADASGGLPSRPGLSGTPGMPGFSGRPGRPGLGGVPGRPGRGGWSSVPLQVYLSQR